MQQHLPYLQELALSLASPQPSWQLVPATDTLTSLVGVFRPYQLVMTLRNSEMCLDFKDILIREHVCHKIDNQLYHMYYLLCVKLSQLEVSCCKIHLLQLRYGKYPIFYSLTKLEQKIALECTLIKYFAYPQVSSIIFQNMSAMITQNAFLVAKTIQQNVTISSFVRNAEKNYPP